MANITLKNIYKISKSHGIMVVELNCLFICCDGFELS